MRTSWYCRIPGAARAENECFTTEALTTVFNLSRNYLSDCREGGAGSRLTAWAIAIGVRPTIWDANLLSYIDAIAYTNATQARRVGRSWTTTDRTRRLFEV